MQPLNVLSMFDGHSTGRLALNRANLPVENYYSSEVDKYAIKISKKNHPGIIYLGNVRKWREWDLSKINLIIAGSPCQGLSKAGKMENFEDPRSVLFFEFADCLDFLRERNPNIYFLLENVRMDKASEDIITQRLGVNPIMINSALVSAQNRERLYWTNIPGVKQPADRGIYLKDIIFPDADLPALHLIAIAREKEPRSYSQKSPTITTPSGGWVTPFLIDRQKVSVFQRAHGGNKGGERAKKGKAPTLTTASWQNNNFLIHTDKALAYMDRKTKDGRTHWDYKHHSDVKNGKSSAITANTYKGIPYNVLVTEKLIRKFHPIECERLQTLPDNYTEGVSDTQRYKMIGNGWTAEVIVGIFENLKTGRPPVPPVRQLDLFEMESA